MDKPSYKISNLKVGLTVFAGLVIFFLLIFLVGVQGDYFRKTYNLKIFVSNVEGLNNGAMVTLGGLKVGSVDKMEFASCDGENGIDVSLKILSDYKNQITVQTKATVSSFGILGDKFINLSLGQPGEELLEENDYIPVVPTLTLEILSERVQPVLDDFTKLMVNLRSITDTIANGNSSLGRLIKDPSAAKNLENVLKNLSVFTTALIDQKGSLGKLAFDETLYDELTELSANLTSLSDSLKQGKGTLGKLLTEETVYTNVQSLLERMNKIINQIESDSSVAGALISNKKFYNDFNSILTDLNYLLSEIKENPQKYLKISVF
jgi:phospholipid/cholesterol/gamma-HCH transport system substrate-binding protein